MSLILIDIFTVEILLFFCATWGNCISRFAHLTELAVLLKNITAAKPFLTLIFRPADSSLRFNLIDVNCCR